MPRAKQTDTSTRRGTKASPYFNQKNSKTAVQDDDASESQSTAPSERALRSSQRSNAPAPTTTGKRKRGRAKKVEEVNGTITVEDEGERQARRHGTDDSTTGDSITVSRPPKKKRQAFAVEIMSSPAPPELSRQEPTPPAIEITKKNRRQTSPPVPTTTTTKTTKPKKTKSKKPTRLPSEAEEEANGVDTVSSSISLALVASQTTTIAPPKMPKPKKSKANKPLPLPEFTPTKREMEKTAATETTEPTATSKPKKMKVKKLTPKPPADGPLESKVEKENSTETIALVTGVAATTTVKPKKTKAKKPTPPPPEEKQLEPEEKVATVPEEAPAPPKKTKPKKPTPKPTEERESPQEERATTTPNNAPAVPKKTAKEVWANTKIIPPIVPPLPPTPTLPILPPPPPPAPPPDKPKKRKRDDEQKEKEKKTKKAKSSEPKAIPEEVTTKLPDILPAKSSSAPAEKKGNSKPKEESASVATTTTPLPDPPTTQKKKKKNPKLTKPDEAKTTSEEVNQTPMTTSVDPKKTSEENAKTTEQTTAGKKTLGEKKTPKVQKATKGKKPPPNDSKIPTKEKKTPKEKEKKTPKEKPTISVEKISSDEPKTSDLATPTTPANIDLAEYTTKLLTRPVDLAQHTKKILLKSPMSAEEIASISPASTAIALSLKAQAIAAAHRKKVKKADHPLTNGINADSDSDSDDDDDGVSPRTTVEPGMKKKKAPHTPTKSGYFSHPSPRRPAPPAIVPPPLDAERFGLIQEEVAHNPYHLLTATIFLNKVRGSYSIPYFRNFVTLFPTPQALLANSTIEQIVEFMRPLGLQTHRAKNMWSLAQSWVNDDPTVKLKGRKGWTKKSVYRPEEVVYRIVDGKYTLLPPNSDDGEGSGCDDGEDTEGEEDEEEEVTQMIKFKGPIKSSRFQAINMFPLPSPPKVPKSPSATAAAAAAGKKRKKSKKKMGKKSFGCVIGHLEGIGCYAMDSWRIFCQKPGDGGYFYPNTTGDGNNGFDGLPPIRAPNFIGSGGGGGGGVGTEWAKGDEEWRRVVPADKELRAYCKWMWAKEGVEWDPPMPPHAEKEKKTAVVGSPLVKVTDVNGETTEA